MDRAVEVKAVTLGTGHTARVGSGRAEVDLRDTTVDLAEVCMDGPVVAEGFVAETAPALGHLAGKLAEGQFAWLWIGNCHRRGVITRVEREDITVAFVIEADVMRSARRAKCHDARPCSISEVTVGPSALLVEDPETRDQLSPFDAQYPRWNACEARLWADTWTEGAVRRVARIQVGDIVTIHRGSRLYEVILTEYDDLNFQSEHDTGLAQIVPCDITDDRVPQWISFDLLHRTSPVVSLSTVRTTGPLWFASEFVEVAGSGWSEADGRYRVVAMASLQDGYFPSVRLFPCSEREAAEAAKVSQPVIQVGSTLLVDGHCFKVGWRGDSVEPHPELAPALAR